MKLRSFAALALFLAPLTSALAQTGESAFRASAWATIGSARVGANRLLLTEARTHAIGTGHGGIGFPGIPHSVTLKFDNWRNEAYGERYAESICLLSRGAEPSVADLWAGGLACAERGRVFRRLRWADGREHVAAVRYDGETLAVTLDGREILRHPIGKLSKWLSVPAGSRLLSGFTAATGDTYFQRQEILEYRLAQEL
jgi:hypothetical protein